MYHSIIWHQCNWNINCNHLFYFSHPTALQSDLTSALKEKEHHQDQLLLMEASAENVKIERDQLREELERLRDALGAESGEDGQIIQRLVI